MRGAVTREDVLDISARLFAANGYTETNLKLVADHLSVTRQALYYHFENKAAILSSLFDKLMTKLEEAATTAIPQAGEPRFAAMIRAHFDVIAENPRLAAILLHERPQIAKIDGLNAAARRKHYNELFLEAYAEGVAKRQLRKTDATLVVNGLLAAGNAMSWWYAEGGADAPEISGGMYALVSQGFLLARGRTPARPRATAARA